MNTHLCPTFICDHDDDVAMSGTVLRGQQGRVHHLCRHPRRVVVRATRFMSGVNTRKKESRRGKGREDTNICVASIVWGEHECVNYIKGHMYARRTGQWTIHKQPPSPNIVPPKNTIPHSIDLILAWVCFPTYSRGQRMVSTGRVQRTMLTKTQESSRNSSPSSIVNQKETKPIVIDGLDDILSVALLVDGKHIVSGDVKGKIRRWRIEDGKEVGTSMDAGSGVLNIAVSRDGRLIVSGTKSGLVTVWNAESHSKVTEFQAHRMFVRAVDVSPDVTKIATGSDDKTVCVWSLTGERLFDPLKHSYKIVAAKFSPDGRLVATATRQNSLRVYDSQNGSLVTFPVQVNSALNHSLAWASNSKQLFALSHDGYIHHVDVSTGTMLSK